jgi:ketosteroid isomerase-like protein
MRIATNNHADLEALHHLNRRYIDAVQAGDVGCFKEILAETFYCSNPDGTCVDRDGFLAQTARTLKITELRAHDVLIRFFGEIAIILARTSYLLADGRQGNGRYTDVWARIDGKWKTVSAHVTRC